MTTALEHSHPCAAKCGNALTCVSRDCWVSPDWLCPNCEARMRDEYFQQLELEELKLTKSTTPRTDTEPTRS